MIITYDEFCESDYSENQMYSPFFERYFYNLSELHDAIEEFNYNNPKDKINEIYLSCTVERKIPLDFDSVVYEYECTVTNELYDDGTDFNLCDEAKSALRKMIDEWNDKYAKTAFYPNSVIFLYNYEEDNDSL